MLASKEKIRVIAMAGEGIKMEFQYTSNNLQGNWSSFYWGSENNNFQLPKKYRTGYHQETVTKIWPVPSIWDLTRWRLKSAKLET